MNIPIKPTNKRLCHSCQVMPAAQWATECASCLADDRERRKVRSFVPLFGEEVRSLPNVGICLHHNRKCCGECIGEKR